MSIHHAYIANFDLENDSLLKEFVANFDLSDVEVIEVDLFGIDDSRDLIRRAYIQPKGTNNKKLLVVKSHSITVEAQQALLKILEEPPVTVIFLFLCKNIKSIIPTLKSRFFEYKSNTIKEREDNKDFTDFCNLNYKERLLLIVKKVDDNDLVWLDNIKLGLAYFLTNSILSVNSQDRVVLSNIATYLGTRGASNKMLLEEFSLTMPYTAEK